jgi:hypothetical protein
MYDIIFVRDKNSGIIPLESNEDNAMFVRSVYGKIFFYPTASILYDNKMSVPKYENIMYNTTIQELCRKDNISCILGFVTSKALFVTNLTTEIINQKETWQIR